MGTKTIGLDDEAYERLRAEKRAEESFSDAVKRITELVNSDWRSNFGKYSETDGERLEATARANRRRTTAGLDRRQAQTAAILAGQTDTTEERTGEEDDETDV